MKNFTLCLALLLTLGAAQAQGETPAQREARMAWWTEARFGMFIHWGPVSLKGTEIGWSRMEPDRTGIDKRMGIGHKGAVPTAEYDALYKRFNPVKFNAREWVAIAKAAGMKYIVLTTKHHDGFCEFDSKLTDYKITNSPFGRDVVKEYADAVHEAGLKLGFYYSQPDFRHPDFLTKNHKRYIKYFHGHVRELLTNYGKVDVLWFDGLGGTTEDFDTERLFKMIRRLQPGIIVNNRCGVPADFDTPEQRIGVFQNNRPWESCITICNQWAWKPNDTMKSLSQCIQTLVSCACGDGNLLFNVGPMPTGEIEPRQVTRLQEMGEWMRRYGVTIYGTRGGPFLMGKNGGSTHKGNTVYLHVFQWPEADLKLPDPEQKIISAKLYGQDALGMERRDGNVILRVPEARRDAIDTVIELTLSGPAEAIVPVAVWGSGSLAAGNKASASNVYLNDRTHYGPQMAVDDDERTRWATDAGAKTAWLTVDLGELGPPTQIGRVRIMEALGRVRAFTIDVERDGQWETVHKGTTIGPEFEVSFKPVETRKVRLSVLEATDGPTFTEFMVFRPRSPKE